MLKHIQTLFLAAISVWAVAACAAEPPAGMVRIPAGVYQPFFRAANDAKEIQVKCFALDVLPVTQGEFLEFVRTHPQWQRSRVKHLFADDSYLKTWAADLDPGTNSPLDAPVTFVSWFAARAFAESKGKRLPTVAEWEFAAQASPSRADGENDPAFMREVLQWYSTMAPQKLASAGAGPANFYGVRDLHGIIWEWVVDFNTAMVTGDSRGDGGIDSQLFCGAGAQGAQNPDNFPAFMRYGFRSSLKADYCVHNLGFRCAKDL